MKVLLDYLSKVKLEFSKVSWLKPKELWQLLITVLVVTVLSASFFALADIFMSSIILKILSL